ncbi:hypothetical protein CSAL01_10240 [Colletotrichum salicis]|uniref:Major facilitator superfamily (MFS) profile domain-containing protein n=1 Tax=Colletotrichum salicis TaxID=1209931 RepID=A0A135U5I9_9PEZI|nr:hypothetical protein CSAL01_10240 [Colletotrichum salicis]
METKDFKEMAQHKETVADGSSEIQVSLDGFDFIEQIRKGKFSWLVSITAAIGGMLFGYDTGIISAVLITSGGAFIGAIFAGATADRFGRKIAIHVGSFLFTAGAVIQAAANSLALMTVGRLVVGFGVGSAAMIIPLYIAELSPAKYRGRMIGLDNMCITGGQLVSYGVGSGFAHVHGGWCYMIGGGAIPAIILDCMLPFCPESPRQLIYHGKEQEAEKVIRKIFPNGTDEQVG